MSSRGRPSAPGMMRHGPVPSVGTPAGHRPLDSLPKPEQAEKKLAVQAAEIARLVGDNKRLAAAQVVLRQDLVAAQKEAERLKAHIRSIQTESDIQIRVLLDKIAKMELDTRAVESVKKDLQQAHKEAHSLVTTRQELAAQLEEASLELQEANNDLKTLPNMLGELINMKQEHLRLRTAFEYEKRSNIDLVEHLREMEKELVGMGREVERLHAQVLTAEKRAQAPAPHDGVGANSGPWPDHVAGPGNGPYYDSYGRGHVQIGVGPAVEGMAPFNNSAGLDSSGGANGAAVGGVPLAWGPRQ